MSDRPNIFPCLHYRDASAMIEWLCRAFGFSERMRAVGAGGRIEHAELSLGSGVIMVSSAKPERGWVSPLDLPAVNQQISIHVDDPDAHHRQAVAAGAVVTQPLRDEEYGSRGYCARDPEGNHWYFGTYLPGAYWGKDGASAVYEHEQPSG